MGPSAAQAVEEGKPGMQLAVLQHFIAVFHPRDACLGSEQRDSRHV